jgi:NAD-dependent DNA ligase
MRTKAGTKEVGQARQEAHEEGYAEELERRCEQYEDQIGKLSDEIGFLKRFVKFKGNSFCFTGALETMTRDKAFQLVRDAGGQPCSTMAHGVSFLVTNDKNTDTEKNKFAKRVGTEIINEQEFLWALDHLPKKSVVTPPRF